MSEIVHGTIDGYSNHRCRCSPCKQAGSLYYASRKVPCAGGCGALVYPSPSRSGLCNSCSYAARKKPVEHGTELEYDRGCRCSPCTNAASAARADRKRKSGR